MAYKVAVYGTLKLGHGNNRYFLGTSKKLKETVVTGFKMYNAGFPVARPNADTGITVEVWEVSDDRVMAALDRLEGVPRMYTREQVTTVDGDECFMYVGGAHWDDRELRLCHFDEATRTYTY